MIADHADETKTSRSSLGGTPALLAALLLLMPTMAFAYVDPGTGSILWQMMLGLLVGAGFYFRRIANWLTRRQR